MNSKRYTHREDILDKEQYHGNTLTEKEKKLVDILEEISDKEYIKFYTPIRKWLGYEHRDEFGLSSTCLWGDEREHVYSLIEPILLKEKKKVV